MNANFRGDATPIRFTLVSAPQCHFCEHAREVLQRLAAQGVRLTIEELDWNGPAGTALVHNDGVPFPPALYINGELLSYGRVSERALRKRLAERGDVRQNP